MSKNQKTAFWPILIGFCVTATVILHLQGAQENLNTGGGLY